MHTKNLASNEYGWWANVNPAVDHPRWSQKTERVLGGGERETEIYNGYGAEVSALYSNFFNLGDSLENHSFSFPDSGNTDPYSII